MSSNRVDTSDLKYQADKNFLPDKRNLWKMPESETGWVLAHNAIREEIKSMKNALNMLKLPLRNWQIQFIKKWWDGHYIHIMEHHKNEDNQLNPFIKTRVNYPDKLETDHIELLEILKEIYDDIDNLKENDLIEELKIKWENYELKMLPHLQEEEDIGLPLLMAYFTPKEVNEVTEKFLKDADKRSLGSFVHWMGSKNECLKFQKNEGIPWFVWYIPKSGFKALRTYYRENMVSMIDSLIENKIVNSKHKKNIIV